MARLTVNDAPVGVPDGVTLLQALRAASVDVPNLCDDYRLKPIGACRLCLVDVEGWPCPVTACNTAAADGMKVRTHTPDIERARRTVLRLLARAYPADAAERFPDAPFHRYLREYGLERDCRGGPYPDRVDDSHRYIRVDMSQCIQCFRCFRICDEVQGQFAWRVWNCGDATAIRPDRNDSAPKLLCGLRRLRRHLPDRRHRR